MIRNILILGGGSAGLLTALSLRARLPEMGIRVVYSEAIGIIGVGEGSTVDLPRHLHGFLGLDPARFHAEVRPTFKLGVHFQWGGRGVFDYTFTTPLTERLAGLSRRTGYYCGEEFSNLDVNSALMGQGKVFARDRTGAPIVTPTVGYHFENAAFVAYLERAARANGIVMTEGDVVEAVPGPEGIAALRLASGECVTADLFIDASGFRSELLGRALAEPFVSFGDTLFCDRAVAGGWERAGEPLLPYTTAETMDSGWAWQIEHERHVNRGYVYSSAFISDTEAEAEFRRRNPKVQRTRLVKFRSGRYARAWAGNVVAIGNSAGFVEPLEATALLVVCQQARFLALALADSGGDPQSTARDCLNSVMARFWDEIRDFLAIHYKYNTLCSTPFWAHCRTETALHGAEPIMRCYQENGPTSLFELELCNPTSSLFHLEGFYALLIGQNVPHRRIFNPTPEERLRWEAYRYEYASIARDGMDFAESMAALRLSQSRWKHLHEA